MTVTREGALSMAVPYTAILVLACSHNDYAPMALPHPHTMYDIHSRCITWSFLMLEFQASPSIINVPCMIWYHYRCDKLGCLQHLPTWITFLF